MLILGRYDMRTLWLMMLIALIIPARAADWSNTQDFPWSKPGAAPTVFHNNKFFLLSGEHGIWSSDTGAVWQCINRNPLWAPRTDHVAAAFNGKIYLLGGQNAYTFYRDIWSSLDGISWTKETDYAPWSERGLAGAVVFGSKLYLIGGVKMTVAASYIGATNYQYFNEIWSTSNCVSWSQVSSAPWPARAMPALTVYNNQLWMMGGVGSTELHDVWSSSNGTSWTLKANTAPWANDWSLSAASLGGKLFVMGGLGQKVWNSTNGTTWTLKVSSAPWQPMWAQSSIVANNKFYMASGAELGDSGSNLVSKIWSTADGTTWEHVGGNNEVWSPRWLHQTVQLNGKVYVLGGMALSSSQTMATGSGEVWRSATQPGEQQGFDKLAGWEAANRKAPWAGRWGHAALGYDNKLWVLGGCNDLYNFSDVWSSPDGTTWTLVTNNAWPKRAFHGAAVYDGKMWVIGGTSQPETTTNTATVFYSTNGLDWTKTADPVPFSARTGMAVVSFDGKLWVIGGCDGANYPAEAWSTVNGSNWTCETASLPFARRDFATVIAEGKLWVIGGYNQGTTYNDVYSSANGINWVKEASSTPWCPRRGMAATYFDNATIWLMGGLANEPLNDVWTLQLKNGAEKGWLRVQ